MHKLFFLLIPFVFFSFISDKNDQKNETLKIPYKGFDIHLTYASGSFPLKVNKIENDTIIIETGSIDDVFNLSTSLKQTENKFIIHQRYKSQLTINFDGKSFVLENWKEHFSPWIELWEDSKGSNVKKYSYFDFEYFPKTTDKEIIEGIITNKKNIGEHWSKYLLKEYNKTDRNKNQEPYSSPSITESQFRLTNKRGDNIVLILKHLIGC